MALEYLELQFNIITFIEDNTFANLMRLNELNLAVNRLESLTPGIILWLRFSRVAEFWQKNRLTTLPADVFNHLPRPLELDISFNPMQCDAALCWLKQEELNGTITWNPFGRRPTCANEVSWETWSCSQTGNI